MGGKRMVVTGQEGQVVRALLERGALSRNFDVLALGRPDLDLSQPEKIEIALQKAHPDVIVSAAAYTAVDKAEWDEAAAYVVNAVAPGQIANAAARLGVPLIHLSTDYVFDGMKAEPYLETDLVGPINAYGRTKLIGERAIAAATNNHVILRTAWVYSPFGRNFVKTMLKMGENHEQINVVGDQVGNPTSALDIADGILSIATRLLEKDLAHLRGVFHIAGEGVTSWADLAAEIFSISRQHGMREVRILEVPSSVYPTVARRPANSQLNCRKLDQIYGIRLPNWRVSLSQVVKMIINNHERNTLLQ